MMGVTVRLTEGVLVDWQPGPPTGGVGSRIVFEGIVRPVEAGAEIEGLEYEAYRPMAEQQLTMIGVELVEAFGLIGMDIEHSTGFVPNFGCSFRLIVESAHRKEGLAAMDAFINRLKADVPIWKRACVGLNPGNGRS
jgi:molybdopterin synthase catalytic subunit